MNDAEDPAKSFTERNQKCEKASEEAIAFLDAHPSRPFLFSVHVVMDQRPRYFVEAEGINPEGKALVSLLRQSFPDSTGRDSCDRMLAFNKIAAFARTRGFVMQESNYTLCLQSRPNIGVLKPLTFKK